MNDLSDSIRIDITQKRVHNAPYMGDIIDNLNTSENKEIIVYKSTSQGPTELNNDISELWKALYFDLAIRKIERLIAHKCMVTTAEQLTEYNGFLTEV